MVCDLGSLAARPAVHLLSNDWRSQPVKRQMHRAPAWRILRRDMNENISLGRIFGIHVGFNWSLLVVAALIAWSLATGILPSAAPGESKGSRSGCLAAFRASAAKPTHPVRKP